VLRLLPVALAVALAFGLAGCDRIIDRQIERTLTRVDESVLSSPDLQVVLCGTGSPLPDPDRAAACTAVIAGGVFVLVDVGPGSWEQLDLANLPLGSLSAVLLTHFHSDHIGDLGEFNMNSWGLGRKAPLNVYGPPGVERVVAGFSEAYALDESYRIAHHGAEWMSPDIWKMIAHPIAMSGEATPARDRTAVVFDDGTLKVTAIEVNHTPVEPAYGYRFDYKGRSIVISGDTARSDNLVKLARGADLLYQVFNKRYQRVSTVVTTNLPFKEWGKLFHNAAAA
jgi:ribonuclease Z